VFDDVVTIAARHVNSRSHGLPDFFKTLYALRTDVLIAMAFSSSIASCYLPEFRMLKKLLWIELGNRHFQEVQQHCRLPAGSNLRGIIW
jgi:hypothetical protein